MGRAHGPSRRREPRLRERGGKCSLAARGVGILHAGPHARAQRHLATILQGKDMGRRAHDPGAGLLGGAGRGRARGRRMLGCHLGPQRQAHPPQAHGERLVPQDGDDSRRVEGEARVAEDRRRQVRWLVLGERPAGGARGQLLRHVQVRGDGPRHARLERDGRRAGEERCAVPQGTLQRDAPLGRHLPRRGVRGDAADVHRRRLGPRPVQRPEGRGEGEG